MPITAAVLAIITTLGVTLPSNIRTFPVNVRILPESINVKDAVQADLKAFRMSGSTPSEVKANETRFRETALFRQKGAQFSGLHRFASDGTWYESQTLSPLMQVKTKTFPYYQLYDGKNTYLASVALRQIYNGDQRGMYVTLGDALFLYGRLPISAKEVRRIKQGDVTITEYRGDLGTIGDQLLRVTSRNGLAVSALSGRASDALKYPLAEFETKGNSLTVRRFSGPNKLRVIETYGPVKQEPYSRFVNFSEGDSVADFRSGQEYRYDWKGGLQSPSFPLSPEGNPLLGFWIASGIARMGLTGYGVYRSCRKRTSSATTTSTTE